MRAEIVSIGTELLLGQIVDTNAQFLAQQLPALGIDLYWISQVGDNLGRVVGVLERAWHRSDLIITSGGLGPTEDDLTREAIAQMLGERLEVDPELERELRALFARRGRPMAERNLKQATLLPSARPLSNPNGTAPGWWVEREGTILVAMPGVPGEMIPMWQNQVVPRLRPRLGGEVILSRTLKTFGVPEATLEEWVSAYTRSINPTLATYAKQDGVHLRLTAKAATPQKAGALLGEMEERLRPILGPHLYGCDEETLESLVGKLLRELGLTLATMESFTGGLVANFITDVPGSSAYYLGGVVAYSKEAKVAWGVPASLIEEWGMVSAEVAQAMAAAIAQRLGAGVGLATTGVAGPEPLEGKSPGTLYGAAVVGERSEVVHAAFPRQRRDVKRWGAYSALNLLRRTLQELAS